MQDTDKKQCPKCKSKNVFDTGNRRGAGVDYKSNQDISKSSIPVYKCGYCGKDFNYLGK